MELAEVSKTQQGLPSASALLGAHVSPGLWTEALLGLNSLHGAAYVRSRPLPAW